MAQKQSYEIELVSEHYARKTIGKPNLGRESGCPLHVPSHSRPLFLMALASVRIRNRTSDSYRWSTEAWRYAFEATLRMRPFLKLS